jgi:hypothetical protein
MSRVRKSAKESEDERGAVELGLATCLARIVDPVLLAARELEREDPPGAGRDDEPLVHDRGRGEHSSPGLALPDHLQGRRSRRRRLLLSRVLGRERADGDPWPRDRSKEFQGDRSRSPPLIDPARAGGSLASNAA